MRRHIYLRSITFFLFISFFNHWRENNCQLQLSLLWWLIYAMSYFRFFAAKKRKNEKTKTRQIHSLSYLRIFVFSNLCGEDQKIRQNKCDNTTDKMCCVFALHLSYLRFFVSSPRRLEKTKARQIHSLSYLRIFVFSNLCSEETNTTN